MFDNFTKQGQKSLLDDKVTAAVVQAVVKLLEDEAAPEGIDLQAVLRGMSSAVVTFAYALKSPDEAKEIILAMAAALDDPETLHWAMTHRPATN